MRFYTEIIIDMATGRTLSANSFDYDGPVEEAKKGRETLDTAGKGSNTLGQRAQNISKADVGIQKGYRDQGDTFGASLIPKGDGSLSPYAAAQLDQQKRDISKTYGDTADVGVRALGLRGMGGAPTGSTASLLNTTGRNADEAESNAYANAQQNTLGQGLKGLQYLQGQQQIYDPNAAINAGSGAYNAATNAGAARSKAGSTLGDIGTGIGALASFVPVPA